MVYPYAYCNPLPNLTIENTDNIIANGKTKNQIGNCSAYPPLVGLLRNSFPNLKIKLELDFLLK